MTSWRGRCCLALVGGGLFAAATPPALVPGGGLLVVPALAVWFVLADDRQRGLWPSYLLGCVHMACFSWSVRHVLLGAYVAIVVVGGLYYALAGAAVRLSPRRVAPGVFAVAVAAAFWLRATMPEIWYPHGQPCHCLWQWPAALGGVAVGGEPLLNGLLAWLAAALAQLGRSWRLAVPARRPALFGVAAAAATLAVASGLGHVLRQSVAGDGTRLSVVAVEPGFHLVDELLAVPGPERAARFRELLEQRLVSPTRAELLRTPGPDLVLWPESSLPGDESLAALADDRVRLLADRLPASTARLCVGVNVRDGAADAPPTPAAVLLELPGGRMLGHHEKRHLVPGGEFLPFVRWLPPAVAGALRTWFAAALQSVPQATPGRELPPLRTAAGVPFGALLCYDNAFPGPAAAQVERGARLLCVLSNEAWYRGGGELVQLVAMSVVRALETGTPLVRCTQDGWSVAVGADGRLLAALPLAPAPRAAPGILRVDVPLGPGRLPPLAWLRAGTGPIAALLLLALALHALWQRARLAMTRTPSRVGPAAGAPGAARPGS